jgi:tetratricopeptide (TPR) repeat protein
VLADSHRYLGWLRYDQERYADAEIWFQRALIMDPQDPNAMAGLGWCYVQMDRCQDATPLFREALGIDPLLEPAKDGAAECLSRGEEQEE